MNLFMNGMWMYCVFINLFSFLCFGWDKFKARHKMWRVPERVLLAEAALGGAMGAWIGMYLFRHKTRHLVFMVGVPFLLFVQLFLLMVYWE